MLLYCAPQLGLLGFLFSLNRHQSHQFLEQQLLWWASMVLSACRQLPLSIAYLSVRVFPLVYPATLAFFRLILVVSTLFELLPPCPLYFLSLVWSCVLLCFCPFPYFYSLFSDIFNLFFFSSFNSIFYPDVLTILHIHPLLASPN